MPSSVTQPFDKAAAPAWPLVQVEDVVIVPPGTRRSEKVAVVTMALGIAANIELLLLCKCAFVKQTLPTDVVFNDRDLLIAALEDIGCNQIRQGKNLEMGSYYSEQSKQKVGIVIPRNSIGNCYGDIGFERNENGDYTPVIDDLDRSRALNGRFITQLRTAYNERVVKRVAARLRGTIHRTVEGGVVKIKVRY